MSATWKQIQHLGGGGHSVVSEHLNFGWWYPYVYIQYFHVHRMTCM